MDTLERKKKLAKLELVRQLRKRRQSVGNPVSYGYPDLLRERQPYEDDEVFETWRKDTLRDFLENKLYFMKDGKRIQIRLIEPMLNMIYETLYKKVDKAILWKPRGSGGSISVSIIIFLCMIYHKMSFILIAGCLLPGTPVWTTDGWKSIEDVKIGDRVWTRKGIQSVYSTTEKDWNGPKTKLNVWGYNKGIEVTSDHKFFVSRNSFKKGKYGRGFDFSENAGEWIPASELTNQDSILLPRPQKINKDAIQLPSGLNWTPELARFIGYWLAEGDCYYPKQGGGFIRLNISKDDEWLGDLDYIIKDVFNRSNTYVDPDENTRELVSVFGHVELAKWIHQYFGKLSDGKKLPIEVLEGLDDEILLNILIGWLRGDGCAKKTNRGSYDIEGASISEGISSGMYYIGARLGILPKLTKESERQCSGILKGREINSSPIWKLRWGSDNADYLLNIAFPHIVQKNRKIRKTRVISKSDYIYLNVKSINNSIYKGRVYDIGVTEDPCFMTPIGIAHNSGEQSKVVYKYVMNLWQCNTEMANAMLAKEPTQTKITMKSQLGGVYLECITATEKASRGKHPPGLVIDEACLLPGTWIITKDKLKKIEDVVAGDMVWTHKGRFRKVLSTRCTIKEDFPCVTIKPVGGLEYSTTGDHRWMTNTGEWRRGWDWKLKDKLFFAKPTEIYSAQLPSWLNNLKGWRFLGWHLGDGFTSKNDPYSVKFVIGDKDEHGSLYKEYVKELFDCSVYENKYEKYHHGTSDYAFYPGKDIVSQIKTICGTKALNKGVDSDLILSASQAQLIELLIGLVDTDGCLSKAISMTGGSNNRISIRTSSDKLISNLILISNSLGFNFTIKRRKATADAFIKGRKINASDSWEFVFSGSSFRASIPYIDPDFKDSRKHDTKDRIDQNSVGWESQVHSIKSFNYTGPVYDIEVEEDTTFSSPYVTFHNSQSDAHTDKAIEAAMQGPLSEPEHLIVACSTFHNATGLYQSLWDYADEKGYKQYRWDTIETMKPCKEPIDCKKCFLTKKVPVFDKSGKLTSVKFEECAGRARTSKGWKTYKQVITEKQQNYGTNVWANEFLCMRPESGRTIYPTIKLIEAEKLCPLDINGIRYVPFDKNNSSLSIGIDWGIVQTAVVLIVKTPEYAGILECKVFSGRSLNEISRYIQSLHRKYKPESLGIGKATLGDKYSTKTEKKARTTYIVNVGSGDDSNMPIPIYGDASHPFNTIELRQLGYIVEPVHFNQLKEFGIENIAKYLHIGRLYIPGNRKDGDFELLTKQLRLYMRDNNGKPVKQHDHLPDALLCAMLAFPYVEYYGDTDLANGGIPKSDTSESCARIV